MGTALNGFEKTNIWLMFTNENPNICTQGLQKIININLRNSPDMDQIPFSSLITPDGTNGNFTYIYLPKRYDSIIWSSTRMK